MSLYSLTDPISPLHITTLRTIRETEQCQRDTCCLKCAYNHYAGHLKWSTHAVTHDEWSVHEHSFASRIHWGAPPLRNTDPACITSAITEVKWSPELVLAACTLALYASGSVLYEPIPLHNASIPRTVQRVINGAAQFRQYSYYTQ